MEDYVTGYRAARRARRNRQIQAVLWRRRARHGYRRDFVYMGGHQRVPRDVTHVRVHESVKIINRRAFYYCQNLVSIEMHDGVEIIEEEAFNGCYSRGIKLPGVRVIEEFAFCNCDDLESVEF